MEKRLTMHYAAIQSSYWIMAVVGMAFLTPILQDRGFDSLQIGIIYAAKSVTTVIAQSVIGMLADKYSERIPQKYFLCILIFVSILLSLIFLKNHFSFMATLLMFILFGCSLYAMSLFIEPLAMQFIRAGRKMNYGIPRAIGSFSWASACVAIGCAVKKWGYDSAIFIEVIFQIILLICVLTYETYRGEKVQNQEKNESNHGFLWLFQNVPGFGVYLAATCLMYISYTVGGTFLIDFVRRIGGDETSFGYVSFISAASEIPIMLLFTKLRKRFSIRNLIVVTTIASLCKIVGIWVAPIMSIMVLVQLFQGIGVGMHYSTSVFFIMERLEEQDMVKGQSLINIVTFGIGAGAGSFISGMINNALGLDYVMICATLLGAISIILMVVARKKITDGRSIVCIQQ